MRSRSRIRYPYPYVGADMLSGAENPENVGAANAGETPEEIVLPRERGFVIIKPRATTLTGVEPSHDFSKGVNSVGKKKNSLESSLHQQCPNCFCPFLNKLEEFDAFLIGAKNQGGATSSAHTFLGEPKKKYSVILFTSELCQRQACTTFHGFFLASVAAHGGSSTLRFALVDIDAANGALVPQQIGHSFFLPFVAFYDQNGENIDVMPGATGSTFQRKLAGLSGYSSPLGIVAPSSPVRNEATESTDMTMDIHRGGEAVSGHNEDARDLLQEGEISHPADLPLLQQVPAESAASRAGIAPSYPPEDRIGIAPPSSCRVDEPRTGWEFYLLSVHSPTDNTRWSSSSSPRRPHKLLTSWYNLLLTHTAQRGVAKFVTPNTGRARTATD